MKKRLDQVLLERGFVQSKQKAQALIMSGAVFIENHKEEKAGKLVASDANLRIVPQEYPYVSRGGLKLEHALKDFQFSPKNLTALDVGASTGGFTHCLLEHGAKRVFALDVGYGQLAWQMRQDPRVVVIERTNIRYFEPAHLQDSIQLVVIDVSFISLQLVFPKVSALLEEGGHVIALVKPQFEAGRQEVGKGGTVKSQETHQRVCQQTIQSACDSDLECLASTESPVRGKKSNNQEFLMLFQKKEKRMIHTIESY